jgi:hypothetical protein
VILEFKESKLKNFERKRKNEKEKETKKYIWEKEKIKKYE